MSAFIARSRVLSGVPLASTRTHFGGWNICSNFLLTLLRYGSSSNDSLAAAGFDTMDGELHRGFEVDHEVGFDDEGPLDALQLPPQVGGQGRVLVGERGIERPVLQTTSPCSSARSTSARSKARSTVRQRAAASESLPLRRAN